MPPCPQPRRMTWDESWICMTTAAVERAKSPAADRARDEPCTRALIDVQAALDAEGIDRDTEFGERVFLKLLDSRLNDAAFQPMPGPARNSASAFSGGLHDDAAASAKRITDGLAEFFGATPDQIAAVFNVPALDEGYPEVRSRSVNGFSDESTAVQAVVLLQAAATQAIGAPPRISDLRRTAETLDLLDDRFDDEVAGIENAKIVRNEAGEPVFVALDDAGIAEARRLFAGRSA